MQLDITLLKLSVLFLQRRNLPSDTFEVSEGLDLRKVWWQFLLKNLLLAQLYDERGDGHQNMVPG
jgi:hypothetical protein